MERKAVAIEVPGWDTRQGGLVQVLPRRNEDVEDRTSLLVSGTAPNARRDTVRRRLLGLADVLGIAAAYALSWQAGAPDLWVGVAATLPLWILINKLLGLYDRDDKVVHKSTLDELPRLLHALTLGALLVFMFAPLATDATITRGDIVLAWAAAIFTVPVLRATVRWGVARSFPPERCVIVGSGAVADILARKLRANPQHRLELVGFIDDESPVTPLAEAPDLLGSVADFEQICSRYRIDRVLVAFSGAPDQGMVDVVRLAKRARIKISVVPRLYEVIGHNVEVDEVEGMTLMTLRGLARSRSSLLLKRALDVFGATVGLVLLSPVLVVIACAIKLTSPGPIFYSAERMGRDRRFRMHKFRSMIDGADEQKVTLLHLNEAAHPMFKIADDPRVTPLGRFLRRTSLDELPQLWNVLRGEMSLVGPRPLVPDEDNLVVGLQRARLDLTPGLTGPWQVAGRTKVPFYEMVTMDYLYVAEWSLLNDIKLLVRTLPVVLFARGH